MANNNNAFSGDEIFQEDNLPQGVSTSSSKLKDYGKKSLSPLVDLVTQYRSDIGPYISALGKGLQAACDSFEAGQEKTEAERVVSGWFNEVNTWFSGAREKIASSNREDFLRFLEEEARARPAVMFSSSYVAGLLFGRMGRIMMKQRATQVH